MATTPRPIVTKRAHPGRCAPAGVVRARIPVGQPIIKRARTVIQLVHVPRVSNCAVADRASTRCHRHRANCAFFKALVSICMVRIPKALIAIRA